MQTASTNPLAKHFRQPQLYMRLPSEGRWYPKNAIDYPQSGEIPVYAMTARDELIFKTPDALMNGQSTVDVIQSCVPNIKDAWSIPTVDLDSILIAIRQATYGNEMEFVSVCPSCQSRNEHAADLSVIKDKITCPDFKTTLKIEGLEIFFKPQSYKEFNRSSLENFEQQRIINMVADENVDEDTKLAKFHQMFHKLLTITVNAVSNGISAIRTEDGVLVEDAAQITEFFHNCNRAVFDAVKEHIQSLGKNDPLKNLHVVCDNEDCKTQYDTPLVFEQSSFFV
jgi:hypothetical protein